MIDALNAVGLGSYTSWVLVAWVVVKLVATSLPPPTTNGWYNWLYTFVNALVLNVLKSKNSSATEVPGPAKMVANGPLQSQAAASGASVNVGGGKV